MDSVAVIDNPGHGRVAIWIAAQVGPLRVEKVNAVVLDLAEDPEASSKIRGLTHGRTALMTRGSSSTELSIGDEAMDITFVAEIVAEAERTQREVLDHLRQQATSPDPRTGKLPTKPRQMALPDFSSSPVESDFPPAQNTPEHRALATANYLARAWALRLEAEDELRRRTELSARRARDAGSRAAGPRARTTAEPTLPSSDESATAAGRLSFTAIDIETANSHRGSPCQVGLVRVRDGRIVDERVLLMRPPAGLDHFDWFNTHLHGITEEIVANAPRWRERLPEVVEFIGDDIMVAHNASFDLSVIRQACIADDIPWPRFRFLCSQALARRALSLPSYRLPFVTDALDLTMGAHHDALADARAAAQIVCELASRWRSDDLDQLAQALNVPVVSIEAGAGDIKSRPTPPSRGDGAPSNSRRLSCPEVNQHADPDGQLYGKVVVFTGTLLSMTREVAWTECAKVGAIPESNTTTRTNILVVGDINPASLSPGAEITGKKRRAFELQAQGQAIEVMSEEDFLRCL